MSRIVIALIVYLCFSCLTNKQLIKQTPDVFSGTIVYGIMVDKTGEGFAIGVRLENGMLVQVNRETARKKTIGTDVKVRKIKNSDMWEFLD